MVHSNQDLSIIGRKFIEQYNTRGVGDLRWKYKQRARLLPSTDR